MVDTLRRLVLSNVAKHLGRYRYEFQNLDSATICDILYEVVVQAEKKGLRKIRLIEMHIFPVILKENLASLPLFLRLLSVPQKREALIYICQVLNTYEIGSGPGKYCEKTWSKWPLLSDLLIEKFQEEILNSTIDETWNVVMKNGLVLGGFFIQSGWFRESAKLLKICLENCNNRNSVPVLQRLHILERMLWVQSQYCMISEAKETYEIASVLLEKVLSEGEVKSNSLILSKIYNTFSVYHYGENRYNEALVWSSKALKGLEGKEDGDVVEFHRVAIDVLRQTATCCSVKRKQGMARPLIKKAVCLAKDIYGDRSVKYADVLMDYGYFLVSGDNVKAGAVCYKRAYHIRCKAFGFCNLQTALTLTELAYSLYVQEYNSGKFDAARRYAERAIAVINRLVPENHLLQSSCKRVLALILEEVAIDAAGSPMEQTLLLEAETLHLTCLNIATNIFGEMNVQSAKHCGNLGRLYQTMKRYQDAEAMHLKAIQIKENLLGEEDYEVALSLGHLASLYNYDLQQFVNAENLHLRSIRIGLALFGESYSGLEYDYRGLLQIYLTNGRMDKYNEFSTILRNWQVLQHEKVVTAEAESPDGTIQCTGSVSAIVKDFFLSKTQMQT